MHFGMAPVTVAAEVSPEKAADIRKLLVVSGIYEQLDYMRTSLLQSYSLIVSGSFTNVPDGFWEEYYHLIGKKEMDDLVDRIIPVYDKHMPHDVVKNLIKMFETPFWQEWREKMPVISREAGQVGNQWGQELVKSQAFNQKLERLIQKYRLAPANPSENESTPNTDHSQQ